MNRKISELLSEKETAYVFPFFWLKGEKEETLREYIQVIYDCGIRSVCLESRPHPDFCGPGWWHDLDIIIEEAKKRNMKLWILDDSHFPTGFCNGAFQKKINEGEYSLLRRSVAYRILGECGNGEEICFSEEKVRKPAPPVMTQADRDCMKSFPEFPDDRFLGIVAVRTGPHGAETVVVCQGENTGSGIRWTAEKGSWRLYGLYLTRNRGPHRDYMNMMSFPSCRILLESVYEPHWQRYHDEFGKTILGFFSDEPEIGNGHIYQLDKRMDEEEDLPWSDELQASLQEKWGAHWMENLVYLWEKNADPQITAEIRVSYMDQVTRLVEKDFSQQIGNWCRNHGVMYIGHMIEDHNQHVRCGSSLGHYFRGLSGQDMAGIDDIGGQVLPQGEDLSFRTKWHDHRDGVFYHFALGKLAASAAAIDPLKKGRSMCEIFGSYGWAEGVNLEKYLADHFMVRGINHFVPHAFSAAEFPDPDCPPHFYAHGHNPQYRHFGKLVSYMERVCHLISDGRQVVDTAILYFAEADWSGGRNQPGEIPGRILAEHQIDYHFIPSDVFTEQKYGTVIDREHHLLRINGMAYRLLIIPETDYLRREVQNAVAALKEAGVEVISMEEISQDEFVRFCRTCEYSHLSCQPASAQIRCLHYLGVDYELYYLVNEASETYRGEIRFLNMQRPYRSIYRYDAWDNSCWSVELTENQRIAEEVTLEPSKGYLYVFEQTEGSLVNREKKMGNRETLLKDWERSICGAVEYPAFHDPVHTLIPDCPETEYRSFGGFVRYRRFVHMEEKPHFPVFLEIEGRQEGIELFVNGVSAGIQVVPVYRFEISGLLKAGENELIIEKATTLERTVPKKDKNGNLLKKPENHCGIDGEIRLLESQ